MTHRETKVNSTIPTIESSTNRSLQRELIYHAIDLERNRQDILHDRRLGEDALAILIEEVGEVGKAIFERKPDDKFEELVQVAAVAIKWLEEINDSE